MYYFTNIIFQFELKYENAGIHFHEHLDSHSELYNYKQILKKYHLSTINRYRGATLKVGGGGGEGGAD